jgi:putative cell wall-binding protein
VTQISIHNSRLHRRAAAVVGLGGALLLAACASTPPEPTVALKAAEQAIAAADRTRVADAASPELSEAREKLIAAQTAVQGKHMVEAERLSLESRVDAELASAKIEAAKARTVNDEMKRSTDTLTQEMQRNKGDKQ